MTKASSRRGQFARFALLGLTPLLGAAVLSARPQSASNQQPTFRAATEVIQLDVSVLDKDRHPIRDLSKADFTVLEDGKPQTIVAFSAVDVPDAPPSLNAVPAEMRWTRAVTPDVTTNALPPEGRLFAMVLDDALMPSDPGILDGAKRAARSVINHLSATDEMAIVFTADGRQSQDFTSDRTKLLVAVEKLRAGHAMYTLGWDTAAPKIGRSSPKPPMMDGDDFFRQGSLNTLRDVAEVLASAPQRRKVLVYVSPGVAIEQANTSPALAHGTGQGMMILEAQRHLAEQLSDIFRSMQRANVIVDSIDPSGLDGLEPYVERELLQQPAVVSIVNSPDQAIAQDQATSSSNLSLTTTKNFARDLAHSLARNDLDFLETTAANTGGRAIVNTNDFEPGIEAMFRENGSYYLLGIQATDSGTGNMHRLSVKVDRPDVEVRTRSGYYASDAEEDKKLAAASPVTRAIAAALPDPGLPMQVTLAPFASSTTEGTTVAIVLGVNQPAPHERTPGTIDLETKAFTPDGYAKGDHSQTVHMTLLPGSSAVAQYELLSRLDLKPGRYQLRIGAHTTIGDVRGSVFADVEVPDFAGAPLSLSGVLLEANPAPFAAPKDALTAIVPIVPTAARSFDRRDRLSAFVRVYQLGTKTPAEVNVAIHVIDEAGQTVVDRVDQLGASDFAAPARAADERIALPLANLKPGEYLLSIVATAEKATAQRQVRFSVR